MKLNMQVAGILLESIVITFKGLRTLQDKEQYIQNMVRCMSEEEEHAKVIAMSDEEPVFYIDEVYSRLERIDANKVPWEQIVGECDDIHDRKVIDIKKVLLR